MGATGRKQLVAATGKGARSALLSLAEGVEVDVFAVTPIGINATFAAAIPASVTGTRSVRLGCVIRV